MSVTSIYRIKTANSIYEIQVRDTGVSRIRKDGLEQRWSVPADPKGEYLDKLVIGASFDVPGVVLTSVVQDYVHYVVSSEPKRYAEIPTTMGEFFGETLVNAIKDQAMGHRPVQVVVQEKVCGIDGCTYPKGPGPSHEGSRMCKSGSIASGGTRSHCSCDYCY